MTFRYLDIGGKESFHCLAESLRNPDGIYINLDINPERWTPEMHYWDIKRSMLTNTADLKKEYDIEFMKLLNDLATASMLLDLDSGEQREYITRTFGWSPDTGYYDIDALAEKVSEHPDGNEILRTKVSDTIYSDDKIVSAFNDRHPKNYEKREKHVVFNYAFYARNQIKKWFFGDYPNHTLLEALKMPLSDEKRKGIQDAQSRIYFVKADMENLPLGDDILQCVRASGLRGIQKGNAMKEAGRILENDVIDEEGNLLATRKIIKVGETGIETVTFNAKCFL